MTTAYFDFDDTIIHGDSDVLFYEYAQSLGKITRMQQEAMSEMMEAHLSGSLTTELFLAFQRERVRGWAPEEFERTATDCFRQCVEPRIYPEVRDWIRTHKARGDRVVIISGGLERIVVCAGHALGVDAVFGMRMEVRNGYFTGAALGPIPVGDGKVSVAVADARSTGQLLSECSFYSDGMGDVPLFEVVGTAICVHPDERLAAHAHQADWEIRRPSPPAI